MAASPARSPYAFPAEVARFLAVEPQDVRRMIDLDGMPATSLPKARRTVYRIYLPDLHRWLISRSKGKTAALADYAEFLARFDAMARPQKTALNHHVPECSERRQ